MSTSTKLVDRVMRPDGAVDVDALLAVLDICHQELASAVGLEAEGLDSAEAQQRLPIFVGILDRVIPWAGDPASALRWYRTQALASFGGTTAEGLVKSGRVSDVEAYLERISAGGYC